MRIDRVGAGIGLFFVAAGVLFLLEGLEVFRVRAAWLWPLLLIGFGLALLAGGIRRTAPEPSVERRPTEGSVPPPSAPEEPPPEPTERVDEEEPRSDA